jgi:chromosomal replication initiation ATPase DnaA
MNAIDTLLSLINHRDHKKALLAIQPILLPDAREQVDSLLADFAKQQETIDSTFEAISQCVSMVTGVIDIPKTTSRKRVEVMARQMVIYCVCAELVGTKKLTLMQVGKYFKNRYNHALIIHCRKSIADLYITDKSVRDDMDRISECLYDNGLIYTKVCLKSTN